MRKSCKRAETSLIQQTFCSYTAKKTNNSTFMKYVLVFIQSASWFEGFLEFLHVGDGEEETRAGGAGGQRAATPCW